MKRNLLQSLTRAEIDRVIQMAWEDRTSFDAIRRQFGLTPGEVIRLMRREMLPQSFRLWRARTAGRKQSMLLSAVLRSGVFGVQANAAIELGW